MELPSWLGGKAKKSEPPVPNQATKIGNVGGMTVVGVDMPANLAGAPGPQVDQAQKQVRNEQIVSSQTGQQSAAEQAANAKMSRDPKAAAASEEIAKKN